MKIRIEVAARKNYFWPYFVQRAKRDGRYSVIGRDTKAEVHVVEFDSQDAALETWQVVRSWKAVFYYVNGQPVPADLFRQRMRAYSFRDLQPRAAMEQAVERADAAEAWRRWRLGLGPEPQ